jgi:hypothetical protein
VISADISGHVRAADFSGHVRSADISGHVRYADTSGHSCHIYPNASWEPAAVATGYLPLDPALGNFYTLILLPHKMKSNQNRAKGRTEEAALPSLPLSSDNTGH